MWRIEGAGRRVGEVGSCALGVCALLELWTGVEKPHVTA